MTALLKDLVPEFRETCEELLARLKAEHELEYVPYFTLRNPFDQARLWRQSRATAEIRSKVAKLRQEGAHFLADCIESVGPQNGRWATNAIPGTSWHQYGEAIDCFLLKDGKAHWEPAQALYTPYRKMAVKLGLNIGPALDWNHIQLRMKTPLSVYGDMKALDERCRELWEGKA